MSGTIKFIADFREVASGIPEHLENLGAIVERKQLKTGDYIINNEIVVERKSREDFIQSIIQGRLFLQCARLKKSHKYPTLLIEGNPYLTRHAIDRHAIKGALLSVSVSWQIPTIFTSDANDSAKTLIMAANQLLKESRVYFPRYGKSKKYEKQMQFFLQGLPAVGPVMAKSLLKTFHTIENIIMASEEDLLQIEGLGKKKAKLIRQFLSREFK